MVANSEPQKLILLCSLYVSQYIPVMFLVQALPIFMRQQGTDLETIGLLSLVALPLILKFLWSPLIDRYGFTPWGHYRFWIIFFQIIAIGLTFVCAGLNVEQHFSIIVILSLLMCVFCASQDIATDAIAVGLLSPEERGFGNGIQTAGHYLGAMLGGGFMLILLNNLGWSSSLFVLAGMMFICLIPIWFYQESVQNKEAYVKHEKQFLNLKNFYLNALGNFTRQPGTRTWLFILLLYMAGGNMAGTMFRPLLVDQGFSLADIGFLEGILGHVAGIVGALFAGLLIVSLGRKRSLLFFGTMNGVLMTLYLLPWTLEFTNVITFSYIAIGTQFGLGAAGTVLLTLIMDRSKLGTAGTDFTVQTSILYIGSIGASTISGLIADKWGYQGAFLVSISLAILVVTIIAATSEQTMFQVNRDERTVVP